MEKYLAARFFIDQNIAAICEVDSLKVRGEVAGSHLIVPKDIVLIKSHSTIDEDNFLDIGLIQLVIILEKGSSCILVGCIRARGRRENISLSPIQEAYLLRAVAEFFNIFHLFSELCSLIEENLRPISASHK